MRPRRPRPPSRPLPRPAPPLCVICLVLDGQPAAKAITTIGGDAICRAHVQLRAESASLFGAIGLARAALGPSRRRSWTAVSALEVPVHEIQLSLVADPLTGRVRVVLRYLASTLTADQIATELFVSLKTVKTHQRGIYRKLGVVGGRRPAVERARQLGLL
jgi:ATP/maltotriose-dependent transcriptional regulator MalT